MIWEENVPIIKSRLYLVSTACLAAIATMLPASAQNENVEGAVDVASIETAEDDEASRTLGTVVVVAQKRAENLQDVPAAVSAFTPDELQSRGIGETSDLMGSLPNIQ